MSYPASVNTSHRLKNTGGRPRRVPDRPVPNPEILDGRDEYTKAEETELGGVELDYGGWGSARLQKVQRGWKWDFISDHQADIKLELGEGKILFPPSRPLGLLTRGYDKPSLNQSLEHVRQICDKYEHLGLDELVTAELQAITPEQVASEGCGEAYDPFIGRRMAYLRNPHAGIMRNVVFFTSGEIGNYLHAAAIIGNTDQRIKNTLLRRFVADHNPLERYPTGVLQMVVSPLISSHHGERAQTLCIRLHSSVHLYRVLPEHHWTPSNPSYPVRLTEIGSLRTANLGGKRVMDMTMDPAVWAKVVLVDESGGVWVWARKGRDDSASRIAGEAGTMVLTKIREPVSQQKNQFFRIVFGTQPGTILVLSCHEVIMIDITDPSYPVRPLLAIGPSRTFTSIEPTACVRQASATCLVTTKEVLWVDEQAPGQPLMSWRHNLSEGRLRDLEITIIPRPDGDCYILSSRSSPVLTVFHTSSGPSLRVLHSPYTISTPIDPRLKPLSDLTILDRAIEKTHGRDALVIVATAKDGSVWSVPLIPTAGQDRRGDHLRSVLSDELKARMENVVTGVDGGIKLADGAETKFKVMDTRWAWLAINKDLTPSEDAPAFTASEFERYLREIDAPFEHFMTAAKLARDCVADESTIKRSQILRPLPLPDINDHESQRLSTLNLERDLHIISSRGLPLSSVDGHLPDDTHTSRLDRIRQTLMTAFPNRIRHSATQSRHQRCIDALALDLALSSAVISSEPIPAPSGRSPEATMSDDDVLARAAGLTINETGPPPIKMSILHPRDTDHEDNVQGLADEGNSLILQLDTPNTRSVLSEWTIGTDPKSYTWKTWIVADDEDPADPTPTYRPIRPLPSPRPRSPIVRPNTSASQPISKYAPPVVHFTPGVIQSLRKTQSIPAIISGGGSRSSPPPNMGSQGTGVMESQEVAATQVERGPFGGRGEKKKKVKKRMGGF